MFCATDAGAHLTATNTSDDFVKFWGELRGYETDTKRIKTRIQIYKLESVKVSSAPKSQLHASITYVRRDS